MKVKRLWSKNITPKPPQYFYSEIWTALVRQIAKPKNVL